MDFNNTGAMRSPFSPRVRQPISGRRSIGLSSAKSTPSKFVQSEEAGDVIYKTPLITVETYGLPLPVMVTEVLTLGSGSVSARLSESGWCWAVRGRRALVWPRTARPGGGAPLPAPHLAARDLTLPQTDLAHKADLVLVFYADGAQMASCVAVSPEGVVRYWPSVGQEGVYCDVSCELAGQECDRLVEAAGALVLATTTCTLVILEPTTVEGRQTVVCRRLCPPSGWLGGIGRRVSLMFFGSMPAHAENKLVGVVGVGGSARSPALALVAGGPVLQLWRGDQTHEHALRRALAPAALHGDAVNADIVALDVQACGTDELLLLLAVTAPRLPDRRYAIAHINTSDPARPVVRAAGALRWPGAGPEEPRMLSLPGRALLYTSRHIAAPELWSSGVGAGAGAGEAGPAEGAWLALEDGARVLGAAVVRGAPALLADRHGLLRLTLRDRADHAPGPESPRASPCPSDMYDGNLSLFEIDPHEISTLATDACGKLKTAFLFHVRGGGGAEAARGLLAGLFPARGEPETDGALPRTLLACGGELLDAAPAGDPRWKARAGAATNISLGSSSALNIGAQLADKRRAFALYVDFLRTSGLLPRAGPITIEGGAVVSCPTALCALAERLAAAGALHAARAGGGPAAALLDAALQQVAAEEGLEEAGVALSPAELCFARVSCTERVLAAVARAPPPAAPRAAAAAPRAAVALLTTVMGEMAAVRAQWGCAPPPQLGPRALLPALIDLIQRTLSEAGARAHAAAGAAALARLVLLAAAPLQHQPGTLPLYERMRTNLIMPFVQEGCSWEPALALAEESRDYGLLGELCARAGDLPRLHASLERSQDEGAWELAYLRVLGAGGAAAAALVRGAGGARLARWLGAAPARAPLAALHALAGARPAAAAELLARVAERKRASLERMTTAASLGKLCLLAAAEEPGAGAGELRARLERALALSEQHEALPRALRLRAGGDARGAAVLEPAELVQLYVEAAESPLSEVDYKKALDLAELVPDLERRDELRLRIWCACILRDEWTRADAPDDDSQYMFFRLIDLVHVMGGDLELVLPPLEDLVTARELAELAAEPAFTHRVRRGLRAARDQ